MKKSPKHMQPFTHVISPFCSQAGKKLECRGPKTSGKSINNMKLYPSATPNKATFLCPETRKRHTYITIVKKLYQMEYKELLVWAVL